MVSQSVLVEADQVVGSREVAALDDAELTRTVARATLFSRVSPEEKLRILPLEHPLFNMVADASQLKGPTGFKPDMPGTAKGVQPVLEGVYVGCRVAAVLSPAGIGGGWAGNACWMR